MGRAYVTEEKSGLLHLLCCSFLGRGMPGLEPRAERVCYPYCSRVVSKPFWGEAGVLEVSYLLAADGSDWEILFKKMRQY